MQMLERWLKQRPLLLTLLLAAGLCAAYCSGGVVSEDIMPLGDSEHFVLRGMTLYGYLHTGQWAQFWDVFTLPRQSIAPPHYWLFFLVPQAWAGVISYGTIQAATTYVLLALGTWSLCRALDRVEWTPALFLLCAVQNISLDYNYFYYVDVPFMAVGTLALAWQIQAWRRLQWRASVLSGVGAGLLFWIKAPNALLFTATFVIAELIRLELAWREPGGQGSDAFRQNQLRHATGLAAGFFPVTFLALACGGFQSIVQLIDANELSGLFATQIAATGLLRLLYFPLCLTFFYHTMTLLVIFSTVVFLGLRRHQFELKSTAPKSPEAAFPSDYLLPLVGAYLILGAYFSFGMQDKEMRSLLLVLPVLWLMIFCGLERCRARPGQVFLAAVVYVVCGLSQVLFDNFETIDTKSSGYQLIGDWLFRFPGPHPESLAEIRLTRDLVDLIHEALPNGGKLAVGTEQLYVTSESLTWVLEHNLALQGRPVPCEFENFLTNKGEISRSGLEHASAILIFTHKTLQYSQPVYDTSLALLRFVSATWFKQKLVTVRALETSGMGPIGYMVVMNQPMTDTQIDELLAGIKATELPPTVEFNPPVDRRLTWAEELAILHRWEQKRVREF